jgi:D-xylose transport system substrate-binding protein
VKSTVWRIMLLCVVVSLLVSLASCGDLGEKPEEIMARPTEVTATKVPTAAVAAPTAGEASGFKLGFILPSKMQQRWPVDEAAFIAEAERLGDSAITLYSNEDERLQATQVEQLLAQDIDALVMIAVNAASAEEMVKKVKAEGIPFIAYDRIILNQDVDAFVTRDNVVVGEQMAQMAVDLYPKGNYVIVSGDEGNMVAHEKTKGIMNVLQPLVDKGDIKIISQKFNRGWATEEALKQVEDALTATNNDIQAAVANNDSLALGAIQALQEAGLVGKAYVCGEDVDLVAAQNIVEGKQNMSIFSDVRDWGTLAAQVAHRLAAGQSIDDLVKSTVNNQLKDVPVVFARTIQVTKDNIYDEVISIGWYTCDQVYKNVPKDQWPAGCN